MFTQKMPWILKTGFLMLFLIPGFYARDASAHAKKYVFNREYKTLPQGMFELESWTKSKVSDWDKSNKNSFDYEQELEYGVTDNWTIAHYQTWQTSNQPGPDDSTYYKGFKFETKYRFGHKGKYWVDPLVYLEWVTNVRNRDNPNKIEAKIVLSKDFGDWNLNYNQVMESELGGGGRTEHGYTGGISYKLPHEFQIGMEAKGDYWRPGSHRNRFSLGPTIAWEGNYFWIAGGMAFGVNNSADDFEARIIVGIPLGF